MTADLFYYLIALALGPVVVLVLQSGLHRLLHKKSPQLVAMVAMVLGYGVYFLVALQFPFSDVRNFEFYLYLFLLYSFGAYTYFHFFNMSETSRRIRMIQAISLGRVSSLLDLKELYNEDQMILARTNRLVALGQIEERQGLYFVRRRLFPVTGKVLYGFSRFLGRPWSAIQQFEAQSESH